MQHAMLLLLLLVGLALAEPIVRDDSEDEDYEGDDTGTIDVQPPKNICILSGKLGFSGNISLLEDCEAVDRFNEEIPLSLGLLGATVQICCPDKLPVGHESAIVFPGDYGTEEYEEYAATYADQEYDDYISTDGEAGGFIVGGGIRLDSDVRGNSGGDPREECRLFASGLKSECVRLKNCSSSALTAESPPTPCGVIPGVHEQLYCCGTVDPPGYVPRNEDDTFNVRDPGFRARECEDHSKMCETWAKHDPESCFDPNHFSFDLMAVACQKSCGICETRGCLDDLSKCEDWSLTHCATSPLFMSMHCKASCGTCGFRSPRNSEPQIVDNKEYSDNSNRRFYCGEGLSFDELDILQGTNEDDEDFDGRTPASSTPGPKKRLNAADLSVERSAIAAGTSISRKKRQLGFGSGPDKKFDPNRLELFYYGTEAENSNRGIRCGSVILADRFVLYAAHCHVSFGPSQIQGYNSNSVKTVLLRDGTKYQESIPIRRVFSHPDFKFPEAYADIAVIELSHRILYDFGKYGDSPSCLGRKGNNLDNQEAISDGYGETETGHGSDVLLRVNLTVISNPNCATYLKGNVTKNRFNNQRLVDALPKGINDQILCTTGQKSEDEQPIYSGPCEGDSGGPLYVDHGGVDGRTRRTVEGIVAGGLTCGGNIPSWFTRVASYQPWIQCIMRQAKRGKTHAEIERRCKSRVTKFDIRNSLEQ